MTEQVIMETLGDIYPEDKSTIIEWSSITGMADGVIIAGETSEGQHFGVLIPWAEVTEVVGCVAACIKPGRQSGIIDRKLRLVDQRETAT